MGDHAVRLVHRALSGERAMSRLQLLLEPRVITAKELGRYDRCAAVLVMDSAGVYYSWSGRPEFAVGRALDGGVQ
jgi:hypothetical protein